MHANSPQVGVFVSAFSCLAGLRVDASVKFNRKPDLLGVKIHEVFPDGVLAPELKPGNATVTQQPPSSFFRLR